MSRAELQSAITEVTVYADRAFITRAAKAELKEDVTEILVGGLPAALDEYSFRAGGRGTAAVKITGIELHREFRGYPADEDRKRLREAITRAKDARQALDNDKALIAERIKFLRDIASAGHDDLSKTIARKRISVEEGGAIMNYFFDSIADLTRRLEAKTIALRLADEELEKMNRQWASLESPRLLEGKSALIRVEVSRPGDFTLETGYVISNAGWQSGYDIRFDNATKKLRLEYKAAVMQQTGESWNGVDLKLSTASPSSGANPPELAPAFVDFLRPVMPAGIVAPSPKRAMAGKELAEPQGEMAASAFEEELDEAPEPMEAQRVAAVVQPGGGPSVAYRAPGKADIPPDGNPHLVLISEEEFGAEVDYILVPEFAEPAYIRARVTNASELVLLPGNTNIYRNEDFVGRGAMELVNPGAEFTCFLGADERLRAKYEQKRFDDDSAGLTGGLRRLGRSASVTLKSDIAEEAKVTVKARRPVAQNNDIKIKSVKFSEKPTEEKDDGTIRWEFTVPPKGERKLSIEYTVEFPKERAVTGM